MPYQCSMTIAWPPLWLYKQAQVLTIHIIYANVHIINICIMNLITCLISVWDSLTHSIPHSVTRAYPSSIFAGGIISTLDPTGRTLSVSYGRRLILWSRLAPQWSFIIIIIANMIKFIWLGLLPHCCCTRPSNEYVLNSHTCIHTMHA